MSSELRKMFDEVRDFGPHYLASGESRLRFFLQFDLVKNQSKPALVSFDFEDWNEDETELLMMMYQFQTEIRAYGRLRRYCYIAIAFDRTEHLLVEAEERYGATLRSRAAILRDLSGEPCLAAWESVTSARSLIRDVMFEEAEKIN